MNDNLIKNIMGSLALNNILTCPKGYSQANKLGGSDFFTPDGEGASYDSLEEFRGFFKFYIYNSFRIHIFGDLELNELSADIYYNDQIFAVLSQELGYEKMLIDLYLHKMDENHLSLELSKFIEVIFRAKYLLRP